MLSYINVLNDALGKRENLTQCTVVATSGSTPLKAGAKMLVWKDGRIFGTIGGGNIEKLVMEDAIRLMESGEPILKEYHLLKEQMCCGGTMKIFIEPMKRTKQLLIFGGGHIGKNIANYAQNLDFKVIVIDERKEIMQDLPSSIVKVLMNHHQAFQQLTFDAETYIVICTHQHEYDREILAHCIIQPHAYLGMIGSKRKVIVTRNRFINQNICSIEQLDRIDMPMGFDIGQNSPEVIALGILAKVVAVSNGKDINNETNLKEYEKTSFDSNGCS